MKTLSEYFKKNDSVVRLVFSQPEEVNGYSCNNFVIDGNYLHLLSDSGKIEYLIPSSTPVEETDQGFVLRNKFYPGPITVQTFMGGASI